MYDRTSSEVITALPGPLAPAHSGGLFLPMSSPPKQFKHPVIPGESAKARKLRLAHERRAKMTPEQIEKEREYKRQYREKNRDLIRETDKIWRKENPERWKAISNRAVKKYRAKIKMLNQVKAPRGLVPPAPAEKPVAVRTGPKKGPREPEPTDRIVRIGNKTIHRLL